MRTPTLFRYSRNRDKVIMRLSFAWLPNTAFMRQLQATLVVVVADRLTPEHARKWLTWEADQTPCTLLDDNRTVPRSMRMTVYEVADKDQAKSLAQTIVEAARSAGLHKADCPIKCELRDKPATQIVRPDRINLFPRFRRMLHG